MSSVEDRPSVETPVGGAPIDAPRPAPVLQKERIQSIDVLRGFALLGILIMNIQMFAMVDAAYFIPVVATVDHNLEGINYWIWYLGDIFADQKFMSIFSMLFGAGIVLMTSRMEKQGRPSAAFHYRRTFILLLFGLAHAYLLWAGDILYSYAMTGFVVYLFRKWKPIWLILVSVIALVICFGLTLANGELLLSGLVPEEAVQQTAADFAPPADVLAHEIEVFRGSWFGQVQHRALEVVMMQTFVFAFFIFWRVAGMMLLGMALFKLGIFNAKRSIPFYLGMVVLGFALGIPMIMHEIKLNEASEWEPIRAFFIHSGWNFWGSICIALAYVGVVMTICKLGILTILRNALAAVGQMALTNYLLHTIICTIIFYGGYGFGLYSRFERWEQALVVLAIWLAQLIISPIWLKAFSFGPFEWLWRTLTYGRWQPMWRPPAVATAIAA